ncbi:MAG: hypothetical protein IPK35_06510 [Saprospiraceae bacterium]|nr:hypothetical protein [Saprospiraceae bacterium]
MDKQTCVFHGITEVVKPKSIPNSSKRYWQSEKQVLYLLLEIALTNHMVDRLTEVLEVTSLCIIAG